MLVITLQKVQGPHLTSRVQPSASVDKYFMINAGNFTRKLPPMIFKDAYTLAQTMLRDCSADRSATKEPKETYGSEEIRITTKNVTSHD